MLKSIAISNFYSIKDEIQIDLEAGSLNTKAAKDLSNNFVAKGNNQLLKAVSLYGANASGKTSIIKAIQFCTKMVLYSHSHGPDITFAFSPFKFDDFANKASTFKIEFYHQGILYLYSFSMTRQKILEESLDYFPKKVKANIFKRSLNDSQNYSFKLGTLLKSSKQITKTTSEKMLFLSHGAQQNDEVLKEIYKYFNEYLFIGLPLMNTNFIEKSFEKNKVFLLKVLQIADSDIIDVQLKKQMVIRQNVEFNLQDQKVTQSESPQESLEFFTYHKSNPEVAFNLFTEESEGTKRFFSMLLILWDVLKNGKTLILDEFDSSLHPNLAQFILDLFYHSKEAQLVFTTHNTNLMDMKLIRKDQIYFVNKKDDGATEFYSLFDFKEFRENMDAEKGYLEGRFDAVPCFNEALGEIRELIHG